MSSSFFGIAFALMALQQAFETARALVQKRVRRLTFRRTFATLDEEPTIYWFDTVYHAAAVVMLVMMSLLMFKSSGVS